MGGTRAVARFRDAPVLQPQEQANQCQEENGGVVLQQCNSSFGAGQEQNPAREDENQGGHKRSTEPGRTREACLRPSLGWNHLIDSPEPMLSPGMMRANSPAGATPFMARISLGDSEAGGTGGVRAIRVGGGRNGSRAGARQGGQARTTGGEGGHAGIGRTPGSGRSHILT